MKFDPSTWDVTPSITHSRVGWTWPRYPDLRKLGPFNPCDDWPERHEIPIPCPDVLPAIHFEAS